MTVDILIKARELHDELESLRDAVEHTACGPGVKSALSQDLMESQERVDAVIRACSVSL